jgi:mRNA interferase YafQ
MQLFRTKTFQKEYAKIKMSDLHYSKYLKYLAMLLEKEPLPPEAKDHPLLGDYEDFREFHFIYRSIRTAGSVEIRTAI